MTSLLHEIYEPKRIQLLIESLGIRELLLEITVPELKKQWVDSGRITEKQFADVEEALGELGAAYIAWFLARSVTDKLIDFDDLDIWANRLKVFKNNNKLMSIKDLGQVKTSSDLEKVANDVGDVRLKNYAKAERAALGASRSGVSTNKLVQDCFLGKCDTSKGSFDVYKIPAHNTRMYAADRALGKGANWCTASAPGYFSNYNDAPLYVFIGKGDEKYQMSISHNEFKDKTDAEVDYTQKWVKEMYDWLIANDSEARYSTNIQRVIDSEERLKTEYPEALKQVEEILEGKNLEDTFSVIFDRYQNHSETFFRIFCEKLGLPAHVSRRLMNLELPICFVYVKGGYALACQTEQRYFYGDTLKELVYNNLAAALKQDREILEREIYPHVGPGVRESIAEQLEVLFDPRAPGLDDFKPELLDGTKFQVLNIEKPLNESTYGYFRKLYFELSNSHLSEHCSSHSHMTVVFLSKNVYFATWTDDFYKGTTNPTSLEQFVEYVSKSTFKQKNTGSAIWERPIEFYYSLWKPLMQCLGLNPVLRDIEAVKKYGHKGELIASRYSLPLPRILDKVDFAYRVPSNRLDLPEMFGAPKAPERGVLFRLPRTWANNAEGNYFVRARDGFVLASNGEKWGHVHARTAYRVAESIMKYVRSGDESILEVPYKTREELKAEKAAERQRQKEEKAAARAAERQRKADERAANREARAAERLANREARAAERAAQRQEPRQRRQHQDVEQQPLQPQQVEPQQQISTVNAGNQQRRNRVVRWSSQRTDTIRNSVKLTFDEALSRIRQDKAAILRDKKKEDMTVQAFEDGDNGKIYIYIIKDGVARVRYFTGGKVIDIEQRNLSQVGNIDESKFKVFVHKDKNTGKEGSLLNFLAGK